MSIERTTVTIDITPTWRQIVDIIVLGIECGTDDGRKRAIDNLRIGFGLADKLNEITPLLNQLYGLVNDDKLHAEASDIVRDIHDIMHKDMK